MENDYYFNELDNLMESIVNSNEIEHTLKLVAEMLSLTGYLDSTPHSKYKWRIKQQGLK